MAAACAASMPRTLRQGTIGCGHADKARGELFSVGVRRPPSGCPSARSALLSAAAGFRRASVLGAARRLERHGLRALGLPQQNLDLLLGILQRFLALARELDAALELLQRVLERQVAALEPLDQRLELLQRLLDAAEALVFSAHLSSNG